MHTYGYPASSSNSSGEHRHVLADGVMQLATAILTADALLRAGRARAPVLRPDDGCALWATVDVDALDVPTDAVGLRPGQGRRHARDVNPDLLREGHELGGADAELPSEVDDGDSCHALSGAYGSDNIGQPSDTDRSGSRRAVPARAPIDGSPTHMTQGGRLSSS